MVSVVELRRVFSEWRTRLQRVHDILNPPSWNKDQWRQFAQGVTILVIDHGRSWANESRSYWDLRWQLREGGELIAQVEHLPRERTTLVVAQQGGFAEGAESYTWLWAEFDCEGEWARDPYWVDGTWKEALYTLLMPLQRQANFYLVAPAKTPDALVQGALPSSVTPELGWTA
jgi:hypothetical protein